MTDMLKQIFKQLWFYRRSNSWLFIELVIIIAVSWFLVHQTWTPRYRIDAVPDGMKSEGVYVVSFDLLQSGHRDYDPQADGEEAWSRDFGRIMDRIKSMPEVLCAAPITDSNPGLGPISAGGLELDSVTYITLQAIERAMGPDDFDVFGYEVVWPENGRIDDSRPMSIIITEDLAEYVFPGENPIGRNLESACAEPDMEYGWTNPIVGVIRSIRPDGCSDNVPAVFMNIPDLAAYAAEDICCAFRLKPDVDAEEFVGKAAVEWRKALRFGNYRVSDVFSYRERIDSYVQLEVLDNNFIWNTVFIFLMINVLLAVASTGWLRLEERRGEIGVRRAMGGSPRGILLHYMGEVWIIFASAAVLGILITFNVLLVGNIGITAPHSFTGELPLNAADFPLLFDPVAHFLAVEGIVLGAMLLAVTVAIIIPAAGALRRPPVEALRDE